MLYLSRLRIAYKTQRTSPGSRPTLTLFPASLTAPVAICKFSTMANRGHSIPSVPDADQFYPLSEPALGTAFSSVCPVVVASELN